MYLIAGIDPGTTVGVAVLDFQGRIVDLSSSKDMSLDRVIAHLISFGRVSVIATDVSHTPSFVSKLAAQIGAAVFNPAESLPVSFKLESTRPYKPGDAHQRDALAAALNFYQRFKNRLERMESQGLSDEVKHMVIRGCSVDEAVKSLSEKPPEPVVERPSAEQPTPSEEERKIRRLMRKNRLLKQQLVESDLEVKQLKARLSALRPERGAGLSAYSEARVIDSLQKSVRRLRHDADSLRSVWSSAGEGRIQPVGVFPEVYNGFTYLKRKLKKKDLPRLENVEIAFCETESDYSVLADHGVLACDLEYLREVSGCFYIRVGDIEGLDAKAVSIARIVDEYRRGRS